MNREAMLRILNRTRGTGGTVVTDPAVTVTCATSGHGKAPEDTLADLLPFPSTLKPYPPGPQGRLLLLLDTWAGMDEAAWAEANVKALYEDILDIFREYPEAEEWYREWRHAHPKAKLI